MPVRPVWLPARALAAALNAGHIEFAELGPNTAAAVFDLMGERVHIAGAAAVRNALPAAMHDDLVEALAT